MAGRRSPRSRFRCARLGDRPSLVMFPVFQRRIRFDQDKLDPSSATGQCSTPAGRHEFAFGTRRSRSRNFHAENPFTTRKSSSVIVMMPGNSPLNLTAFTSIIDFADDAGPVVLGNECFFFHVIVFMVTIHPERFLSYAWRMRPWFRV